MFINISNHPFSSWEADQLKEAQRFGEVYDIPFPNIPSDWGTKDVSDMVYMYMDKITQLLPVPSGDSVVHVMGESVFTFLLVSLLVRNHYKVVASTTERVVTCEGNTKISKFKFIRFRSYSL